MKLSVGKQYELVVEGKHLVGTLIRIVGMSAPCVPSKDPKEWSYHFEVESVDPSIAGTYCIGLDCIKGLRR